MSHIHNMARVHFETSLQEKTV